MNRILIVGAFTVVLGLAALSYAFSSPTTPVRNTYNGVNGLPGVVVTTTGSVVGQISLTLASSPGFVNASLLTGAAAGESTDFRPRATLTGGVWSSNGTTVALKADYFHCDWGTAGVNGGGQTVVVKLQNLTSATEVCKCTLGACDAVANTDLTCECGGVAGTVLDISSASTYAIQLSSDTNCTTNPINIECGLRIDYNFP